MTIDRTPHRIDTTGDFVSVVGWGGVWVWCGRGRVGGVKRRNRVHG